MIAIAIFLRWVALFPVLMSPSSTYGPLKEMVVKMAPSMLTCAALAPGRAWATASVSVATPQHCQRA